MTRPTRIRISRREAFNAAHQLWDPARSDGENRRLFGKCVNLHGHNYAVEVVVRGDVDPATGYLIDLKRLSDLIGREVIADVDHRNLNTDVPWLSDRIGGRDPFIEALLICFSIGLVWELALRGGAARRRSGRRARPIGLQRRDRCALPARHGFRRTPTGPLATVSHV